MARAALSAHTPWPRAKSRDARFVIVGSQEVRRVETRRSHESSADNSRPSAGRPPVWPRRRLIDGIRFRVRTGVPWRDVPVEYGPWGRIYDLFRRWQRNGTWRRILTRLQSLADTKGAITWDLSVGSMVCRSHQHAAGARKRVDLQKEPPGGIFTEPRYHGLGRSRGGFTSKLHLAVEQGQKPMSIVVTAGQRGDSPQF